MVDRLRLGVFFAPYNAVVQDPTDTLTRDLELLLHLDRLGYDEAWIGEHHSGGVEIIASPELFIAAAAGQTRHIRLGTGVLSLPYHHPLMVADRMTQLDHMTRGRAMLGVGPGALVSDAVMMGINPADQRRRMNEGLEAVVRLLRGETVSMETDWFKLREARLQLPPYTRPHIDMAVAAARSPAGASAAGNGGWGCFRSVAPLTKPCNTSIRTGRCMRLARRKTVIAPTGASWESWPRCMWPRLARRPSRR